jgi:hypothetical protein
MTGFYCKGRPKIGFSLGLLTKIKFFGKRAVFLRMHQPALTLRVSLRAPIYQNREEEEKNEIAERQ